MDSNHNKQIQNLRCYHYTMRQWIKNGANYSTMRHMVQAVRTHFIRRHDKVILT